MEKPTKVYTLQRLYYEAKALIEKYNEVHPDFELRVSMDIYQEGELDQPNLSVHINYEHGDYKERNRHKSYWGYSHNPGMALSNFEEEIIRQNGYPLINRVGVEIAEEGKEA